MYFNNRERKDKLSTSKVGALNELRVCSDLISKGFEVFRAVSPACLFDVYAEKNGVGKRIEVRTAYKNKRGDLGFCKNFIRGEQLALVLPDQIVYIPTLN